MSVERHREVGSYNVNMFGTECSRYVHDEDNMDADIQQVRYAE
jgi:hypothetical protein